MNCNKVVGLALPSQLPRYQSFCHASSKNYDQLVENRLFNIPSIPVPPFYSFWSPIFWVVQPVCPSTPPQALQAGDVYRLQVMLNLQPQALLERAGEMTGMTWMIWMIHWLIYIYKYNYIDFVKWWCMDDLDGYSRLFWMIEWFKTNVWTAGLRISWYFLQCFEKSDWL